MADESDLRPLLSARSAGSNLVTDFAADKISILRDGGAMCASGAIGVLAHSDEPSSTQFRKRARDARRNAEMFLPLQGNVNELLPEVSRCTHDKFAPACLIATCRAIRPLPMNP